jgi:hypothetical protein
MFQIIHPLHGPPNPFEDDTYAGLTDFHGRKITRSGTVIRRTGIGPWWAPMDGSRWYCRSHHRPADLVNAHGTLRCDPRGGGLLIPCIVEPYFQPALRSEKTRQLDRGSATVAPSLSASLPETPSEQVTPGADLKQQQDEPPFPGNSGASPQIGLCPTDGSGAEMPRPQLTSAIA